jgi:non-ribosomal peptide synthetase component F
MTEEQEVRDNLRQFVLDELLLGDASAMLADGDSFLDTGTIDSTGVLEVVTFIETRFGIQVADREMVPENLDSIDRLSHSSAESRLMRLDGALLDHALGNAAQRSPAKTALVCGERRTSYGELDAGANALAHALRALGLKRQQRVAICLDNSVEAVQGLYATMKAAGVFVIVNPQVKGDKLAFIVADCNVHTVLTSARCCRRCRLSWRPARTGARDPCRRQRRTRARPPASGCAAPASRCMA